MTIKKLSLKNFRNIKNAEFNFCSGVNIFTGENGIGKTNILEAISICLGKSFKNSKTSEYIPFNTDKTVYPEIILTAFMPSENREIVIKYSASNGVFVNGINFKNVSALFGNFRYVVFTPNDRELVSGEPKIRRNFLDDVAIFRNKAHKKTLYEYNRALKQIKSLPFIKDGERLLPVLTDILAKQGVNLTFGRTRVFREMKSTAVEFYKDISDASDSENRIADFVYKSAVFGEIKDGYEIDFQDKTSISKMYNRYANGVFESFSRKGDFSARDIIGAHRDDIIIKILTGNTEESNLKPARTFASEGQSKSLALALKSAEAKFLANIENIYYETLDYPVILLDDVFAALDEARKKFLVSEKAFKNSQIFVATCDTNGFSEFQNEVKVFDINQTNGNI